MEKSLYLFPVILFITGSAWGYEKPMWELGIGAAIGTFPSYRGASSLHTKVAPFPLIIYHGERISVDREGLHGRLFESTHWRLELSADAMVPSEHNDGLRTDMPELAPILELGPSLEYLFSKSGETTEWRFRLPLRGAIAVDSSSLNSQGVVFHPNLAVDTHNGSWELGGSIGPLFGSEDYHNYYYGISSEYVTAQRTLYKANKGYSGLRLTLGASRYFGSLWLGMFVRYDDLNGTVFVDSPLLEQRYSLMGGMALSWILSRSERMVER
jgi:outer membrane protein